MTNSERIARAYQAVMTGTDFGQEPESELPTYVTDLLANLMHLCHAKEIDFEARLRRARDHVEIERIDERA